MSRPGLNRRTLCLVGFVALAVRALVAARTAAIYPDGAIYLRMAEDFLQGELGSGLRRVFHPAYPALIAPAVALGERVGLGAEACAAGISAALGATTVVLLSLASMEWAKALVLSKPTPSAEKPSTEAAEAHSEQIGAMSTAAVGLTAAALALLHPALLLPSGQVQAYAWTHAALAAAMLFAARSLGAGKGSAGSSDPCSGAINAALAGVAAGLGFLGRPDMILGAAGLGAAFVIAPWLDAFGRVGGDASDSSAGLEGEIRADGATRWRLTVARALPFVLGFLVTAGPYIGWVSIQSGRLRLSLKKDPAAWLRSTGENDSPSDGPAPVVGEDRFVALRETLNKARGEKHRRGEAAKRPGLAASLLYALKQSGKAAPHWLLVTAAAGAILVLRRGRGDLVATMALPALAFLAGHTILRWKAGYLSTMHTSYQALLVIPATALALPAAADWLDRRLPRRLPRRRAQRERSESETGGRARVSLALLVGLAMLPGLPVLASRPQEHKAIARELGAVLKRLAPEHGARPLLVGEEVRQVAWYGGADFLPLAPNPAERRLIEDAAAGERAFLLVYLRVRGELPGAALREVLDRLGPEVMAPTILKRGDRRYLWWLRRLAPARTRTPSGAGTQDAEAGDDPTSGRARSAGAK